MSALAAQHPERTTAVARADGFEPAGARLYLWGFSAYCYKVQMAAALKGVRFDEHPFGLDEMSRSKQETGLTKVPVIETSSGWITDSTHILEWLEERRPSPSLYPSEARAIAECRLLEDWGDEALAAAVEPWLWLEGAGVVRLSRESIAEQPRLKNKIAFRMVRGMQRRMWKQRARRHGGVAASRALIQKQIALLDERLGDAPWLFGDAPSAADLAIASQLMNLLRFSCDGDVEAKPRVAALVRRAAELIPGSEAWLPSPTALEEPGPGAM